MFNRLRKRRVAKQVPVRTFLDEDFPEVSLGSPGATPTLGKDELLEWMSSLDESIRPVGLAGGYPRIAVQIMLRWSKWDALQTYLMGLILDDRGGREGFQQPILKELMRLQAYVAEQKDLASSPVFPLHGEL